MLLNWLENENIIMINLSKYFIILTSIVYFFNFPLYCADSIVGRGNLGN